MPHRVVFALVLAAAAIGLGLSGGAGVAAPTSVPLDACATAQSRTAVVAAGGDVALSGPTFLGRNLGAIQDFLNGATTTLSLNGVASAAGAFGPAVATTDPVFGAVWATTWSASVPGPAVGAPVRVRFAVTFRHPMPQLLAPAADGNAGFGTGATVSRTCTLDGGQPVTAGGGTVSTADHGLTLTIPSGAVTAPTTITADPSTATPPPAVGATVGTAYDLGPSGTQFQSPVTVSLTFDPASVPAGSGTLHLAGLSNGVWRLLPSTVNATTHTVSAQVRHFSAYAVVKAACSGYVVGGLVTDGAAPITGVQAQEITGSISAPTATDLTDVNGEYALCVPDGTTIHLRYEPPTGSAYASQWYSGATTLGASTAVTVAGADVRADVILGPGTPITGIVSDRATGLPLANAFVTIHQVTPSGFCCQFGVTLVERTTTDATGRYHAALPTATYKLVAFPPSGGDYVNQWWRDALAPNGADALVVPSAASGADVSFALAPGVRISGRITDGAGSGLSGAGATAFVPDANGNPSPVIGGGTDASGSYSMVVPPGTYRIQFNPPQGSLFLRQWWNTRSSFGTADPLTVSASQPAPAGGVNAALVQGYRISGTLRDATTGAAIGGGNVSASLPLAPGACCKPQNVAGTNVAADGTFTLAVPAGTYIVHADGPPGSSYVDAWYGDGRDPHLATQMTLDASTPNAATGLDLRLQPGFVISGTLRDATSGAPIANGNVGANLAPAGACCTGAGGSNTQADGTFWFTVPAGTYILNADGPRGSSYISTWYGGSDPSTATQLTIGPSNPSVGTGLALTLQPGFRISGTVTDASGAPFANAGVNANIPPPVGGCCPSGVAGVRTQPDGTFTFAVPAGTYILYIGAPQGSSLVSTWYGGTVPDAATRITVSAASPTAGTGLAITLVQGYRISGTVTDASTGFPIANVYVEADLQPTPGSCCTNAGGSGTDATGGFSVAVPAGTYILRLNPPQGSVYLWSWYGGVTDPSNATSITVGPATPTAGVGLAPTLSPGLLVSGTVRDSSGAPVAGAEVDLNAGPLGGSGCCYNTRSLADGSWSLRVAPGSYVLYVAGPSSGPALVAQWWPNTMDARAATVITRTATSATPPDPIAVVLQPGFRVSGTVTDPSGAGVAHVGVTAQDATQPCCRDVAAWGSDWVGGGTDASGHWELVVPAGSFVFSFFPNCCMSTATTGAPPYLFQYWNGKGTFATADILTVSAAQLPPAGGVNVALSLGYRISGTVTDAGSGMPVANVWVNAQDASQPCCAWLGGGGSDATGRYSIVVPAGASVKVQFDPRNAAAAYLPQWYSGAATFDAAATLGGPAGGATTSIDARLATGLVISGHLTGAGGTPLANAWVVAQPGGPDTACCSPTQFSTGTDSSGAYRLVVPAGTYRIQANAPQASGYLPTFYSTTTPGTGDFYLATDVTAPASAIDIPLQPGLHIRGTVTSGGIGIGGVNVAGHRVTASGQCCDLFQGTTTGPDGSYDLVVASGSWRLRFTGPPASHLVGTWYGSPTDFNAATNVVVGAADVAGVDVSLAGGVWISGRVFGPDGVTPLAGVGVQAQTNASCCVWSPMQTWTDATGSYRLAVPAGATYRIQVSPNDQVTLLLWQWYSTTNPGTRDFAQGTDVPVAGADVAITDTTLRQGYAIRGHVTVGGAPTPFVNVSALDATVPCCAWAGGSRTQADGSYVVVVPAGTYKVSFDISGHPQVWYGGSDFATAAPLGVPPGVTGADAAVP